MSTLISPRVLLAVRDSRQLLVKWIVALLVPLAVFTFIWSGEAIANQVLLGLFVGVNTGFNTITLVLAAIFVVVFYAVIITLSAYLVAADSGQRGLVDLWLDILVYILVPLFLVIGTGLIIGLALSALIWAIYLYVRGRVFTKRTIKSGAVLSQLAVLAEEQRDELMRRAVLGGFWFATAFAVVSLILDVVFYIIGDLPDILLVWVVIRTILLPIAGYFLGYVGGLAALRRTIKAKTKENGNANGNGVTNVSKKRRLEVLSTARALEEAKDLVPNDLPLSSTGAQRFYLLLLTAFILFYPFIDPFLFGPGTDGRLAGYGDAGYYVILALGLNIVVGFAGLLDLGYVAFFAIGSYAWAIFGSTQWGLLTGLTLPLNTLGWYFWPMLLVTALIAAFFGVLLGAPTLRLRGDYLAIVTLGFGEIVPVVFLELDKYTNGPNGIVGVQSPHFFGIDWSAFTPGPYYYLIVILIVLVILANIRLRDSRLGRAWIAIREDEIAAASSGVNLVSTKLLAFAAGAFFSGIAGAYHAAKLGGITPDSFSFGDSVIYLAMVVIGGIGSIPGVIVGALTVYAINQFILAQLDTLAADPTSFLHLISATMVQVFPGFTFGNIRNLVFGVILVTVMIFRPEGFIPSARRKRELHRKEEDEGVEVGALDVIPGAPGFESEMRIE